MRSRAITLIEILTVIGIIAILAGICYPLSAPMRENAKQVRCMANMQQIYQSMMLYAAENPETPQLPNLNGIPEAFFLNPVEQHMPEEILWCPDAPDSDKKRFVGGSYNWNYLSEKIMREITPSDRAYLARQAAEIEKLGSQYAVVICYEHDIRFYHPREAGVDPSFQKPFAIELRASGQVVRTRRDGLRPHPR